ncbi:hypothetical protein BS17DRAFT_440186 [Gyrodon lividus]|nr:hypothetical protein BS17DRAFT_440186 [Gyrodon lividus]
MTLRKATRDTAEYARLKHLYQSEKLVTHANPPSWRVKTPDRHDVVDMLAKMIRAVDEEFLDDGLTSVGDTVLPHISHWDKLATLVIDSTVVMAILPVVLGVSALVIAAGIVAAPFVLSYELIKSVKWQLWYHRQSRAIDRLQLSGFQ